MDLSCLTNTIKILWFSREINFLYKTPPPGRDLKKYFVIGKIYPKTYPKKHNTISYIFSRGGANYKSVIKYILKDFRQQ